jgi:hypothetical protein
MISGLYYKHVTIINEDSSIVNKFGVFLTDNARVINYDRKMFLIEATGPSFFVHSPKGKDFKIFQT